MQELIRQDLIYRTSLRLGDFGAGSAKHTWLYSSHACIAKLPSYKSRVFTEEHKTIKTSIVGIRSDGTVGVWGSNSLKGTQEYPIDFGRAVVQLYHDHLESIERDLRKLRAKVRRADVSLDVLKEAACGECDTWPDACLRSVVDVL